MSRSMRRAVAIGAPLLALAGFAIAQQTPQPAPAPAVDIAALYRPFPAPPGERTRADIAWPAPTMAPGTLPAPIAGIGRAATNAEIAGWDIAVRGDGHNLPPGRGTAKEGEELFHTHCASCHGDFGEGLDRWPALMGGRDSLRSDQPRRTVGSFWQHAPGVFDYIRRAMPYTAPQSLTNDEYYALTAYVLFINELVGEEVAMDRDSLPRVADAEPRRLRARGAAGHGERRLHDQLPPGSARSRSPWTAGSSCSPVPTREPRNHSSPRHPGRRRQK